MADVEKSRHTHMLRIYNPDDSTQYVDVKIIDQISFIVPYEQYWEHEYHHHNNPGATKRKEHEHLVKGTNNEYTNLSPGENARVEEHPGFSGDNLDVYRPDFFPLIVPFEQYWERDWLLKGNAPAGEPWTQHLKMHLWKVTGVVNGDIENADGSFGTPDEDTWVVMERIDTISTIVSEEQYWEFWHILDWPDDDVENPDGVVDESHNPDGGDHSFEPYRFDVFQNPVDVRWGISLAVEFYPQGR